MASLFGIIGGFFGLMKKIPMRVWVIITLVIVFLFITHRVVKAYNDHQAYVEALELKDVTNTSKIIELNGRLGTLAEINRQNKFTYEQKLQQANDARRIAEEERASALKRADHYRSIRDEIHQTPADQRQPVSPVVRSTIERLWGDDGEGTAGR